MSPLTILFIADICGRSGRQAVAHLTRKLREKYQADYIIANVENAAGGFGITPEMSKKIFAYGVDLQTSGNHIWDRVQILEYIESQPKLLRPANYPKAPGKGMFVDTAGEHQVAVLNLMGRVYMPPYLNCPFRAADRLLSDIKGTRVVIVDFHAEATSEKQALAHYLDGRVSAVLGTHTHVPTADERISEKGTAYITDTGMTGAQDSIIGMEKGPSLGRFLTGMPKRFSTASEDVQLMGVELRIDPESGRALEIRRFSCDFDITETQADELIEME
jgi:metallophosphoesterase (TIGR00282 family)